MSNLRLKKRRLMTLIEIMIVMFLIAMITGVVAYNYRGTLEEGKAFKTKASMDKIIAILNLAVAEDPSALDDISGSGWQKFVERSSMVQDAKSVMKDGWGGDFRVEVDPSTNYIIVVSEKYNAYMLNKKSR